MTNNNFKNNKTKAVTIVMVLSMTVLILLPSIALPHANAQNSPVWKAPLNPTLTMTDKDQFINTASNVSGVKTWSNQWQFENMDFMGQQTSSGTQWKYAVIQLHLPSNDKAPFSCDIGWTARVKIDLGTKQVVDAWYPTLQDHVCHGIQLGRSNSNSVSVPSWMSWLIPQAFANPTNPGFSVATEDDVISNSGSLYGSYAEISTPSYSSSNIFNDMNEYVAQTLNVEWSDTNVDFTQAGWVITDIAGGSGSGISADSADVVYVDTSSGTGTSPISTGYSWVNGQTEQTEVYCSGGSGSGSDYVIAIGYGSNVYNHNTSISCSTHQDSSNTQNSVWFENWNTSSYTSWYNDITGSVTGTSAYEFDSSANTSYWSSSTNTDIPCSGSSYSSNVLTSNIDSGGTATWSYLNNQPYAC